MRVDERSVGWGCSMRGITAHQVHTYEVPPVLLRKLFASYAETTRSAK